MKLAGRSLPWTPEGWWMFTHHWYSSQEERGTKIGVGGLWYIILTFVISKRYLLIFSRVKDGVAAWASLCKNEGCFYMLLLELREDVTSLTSYFFFFTCLITVAFKFRVINGEGGLRIGTENPIIVALLYWLAYCYHCSLILQWKLYYQAYSRKIFIFTPFNQI